MVWRMSVVQYVLFVALVVPVQGQTGIRQLRAADSTPPKTTYDYVMPLEQQERFLRTLQAIRLGDERKVIVSRLDSPPYDQVMYEPRFWGKFNYRVLTYFIKRWEFNLVNEIHDQRVDLYFDEQDRLIGVDSSVEGYRIEVAPRSVAPGPSIGELMKAHK